jgi:hypothetical protein
MERKTAVPPPIADQTKSEVKARAWIIGLERNPQRMERKLDAAAMAEALHRHAMETGEPIPPELAREVSAESEAAAALVKATALVQKAKRRAKVEADTIGAVNEQKKKKARADYKHYVKVAEALIATNGRLRRATKYQLAQQVRKKLFKDEGKEVSERTIVRALTSRSK